MSCCTSAIKQGDALFSSNVRIASYLAVGTVEAIGAPYERVLFSPGQAVQDVFLRIEATCRQKGSERIHRLRLRVEILHDSVMSTGGDLDGDYFGVGSEFLVAIDQQPEMCRPIKMGEEEFSWCLDVREHNLRRTDGEIASDLAREALADCDAR